MKCDINYLPAYYLPTSDMVNKGKKLWNSQHVGMINCEYRQIKG